MCGVSPVASKTYQALKGIAIQQKIGEWFKVVKPRKAIVKSSWSPKYSSVWSAESNIIVNARAVIFFDIVARN